MKAASDVPATVTAQSVVVSGTWMSHEAAATPTGLKAMLMALVMVVMMMVMMVMMMGVMMWWRARRRGLQVVVGLVAMPKQRPRQSN